MKYASLWLLILLNGCAVEPVDARMKENIPAIKQQASTLWQLGPLIQTEGPSVLSIQMESQMTGSGDLKLTMLATNQQNNTIHIRFHSGMVADLSLYNRMQQPIWRFSDENMFTEALREVALAPNKSLRAVFRIPSAALNQLKGNGSVVLTFAGQPIQENLDDNSEALPLVPKSVTAELSKASSTKLRR